LKTTLGQDKNNSERKSGIGSRKRFQIRKTKLKECEGKYRKDKTSRNAAKKGHLFNKLGTVPDKYKARSNTVMKIWYLLKGIFLQLCKI
jgi:hypothetical protein